MACLWSRRSSAIFRSSGVRPVNWRDGLFPLSRVVPWPHGLPRRLLPPSTPPELPHIARHSRAHRPADLRAVRHGKDEGELPDTADDAPDAKTRNAHDGRHRYEAHIAGVICSELIEQRVRSPRPCLGSPSGRSTPTAWWSALVRASSAASKQSPRCSTPPQCPQPGLAPSAGSRLPARLRDPGNPLGGQSFTERT
jgi:hypothetical protein